MRSLLDYTDYRQFIKDFYTDKKSSNSGYSLRVLSEKAGFKARDYVLRVMNGTRNLSQKGISALAGAMKLNDKERLYFEHLVHFNQADTTEAKDHHFRSIIDLRKSSGFEPLLEDQYEYFSAYHHAALRSLLPVINFNDKHDEIGRFFDPPLSSKQIRQSIDLLIRLGLLKKDSDGRYSATSPAITTGDEVKQVGLAAFHKACLQLAIRSLYAHSPARRDISGVTLSISQNAFEQIKEEISVFRKKIMTIAHEDSDEDTVYQFNLQLFPLTHTRKK